MTGEGISQDFLLTPSYAVTKNIDVSATIGYGSASGTGNVVNYWGDAIMPSINTNLGSRAYTLVPTFTTHNGQDPISATKLGFLSGSVTDHNGNGGLSVGWFNLHQSVPWALNQAPWVSQPFQLAPQMPGTLGDGAPAIDVLKGGPTLYPLSGADLWFKNDLASVEITTADLPAPSNSPARILSGSVIIDHGDGLKYSGQITGLRTWGPDTGRVLFGSNAAVVNGVGQSTVFGQSMVVLGVGATLPLGSSDGELRYGYSCYGAIGTALPSATCTSGNYYYGKLHHGFAHFDVILEGTRNEATYAPAILDYGTIENVWTYPAALPNTWLRGNYQLVDNSQVGANREGGKITTTFIVAGVEVRLAFGQYQQIRALDASSAFNPGFVEPFFLPQVNDRRYARNRTALYGLVRLSREVGRYHARLERRARVARGAAGSTARQRVDGVSLRRADVVAAVRSEGFRRGRRRALRAQRSVRYVGREQRVARARRRLRGRAVALERDDRIRTRIPPVLDLGIADRTRCSVACLSRPPDPVLPALQDVD